MALLVRGEVESENPVTAPVTGNNAFAKWLREWTAEIKRSPVLVEHVPLKKKAGADKQKKSDGIDSPRSA
jgi:hypothetical protein